MTTNNEQWLDWQVLYEDQWLLAIDKPSGVLVHPSWLDKHETHFAIDFVKQYWQVDKVHCLHRLDRPTCGVLLFAKDKEFAHIMSQKFAQGDIEKHYLTLVRGFTQPSGYIDYALKVEYDKIADKPSQQEKEPQEAQTAFETLAQTEVDIPMGRYEKQRYSLVWVSPKTGRKHQIRRHFKHIFHHLIGDTRHGDGNHNKLMREHFNWHRLALRAMRVSFEHPISNETIKIDAPVPLQWANLFNELNIDDYRLREKLNS